MQFYQFAYWQDFDTKINNLATISPEPWGENNNILRNYIIHTYYKLTHEDKIIQTEEYALFNTGLITTFHEPIIAYFRLNKLREKQKWFFEYFATQYQLTMLGITEMPKRANYFSDPGKLIFNTEYDILPQYEHIFNDPENQKRIPKNIDENPNKIMLFHGAIQHTKHLIDGNYRVAIPQYYNKRIQLLIPLYLMTDHTPDLALVVYKPPELNYYLGYTCLSIETAYMNARLIAKPENTWLNI